MAFGSKKITSNRLSKKKRQVRLYKTALTLLVFLIIFGILAYASGLDSLEISSIQIKGNSVTPESEIQELVLSNISGSYLGLYSRRNFVIYPRRRIKDEILKNIPRVKKADVSLDELETLIVQVEERRPEAIWCGVKPAEKEGLYQECFFLDSDGLIYSKAPNFSGNVFVRYYGTVPGEPLGEAYTDSLTYKKFVFLVNSLEELGLSAVEVVRLESGDHEIHLEEGGRIILNEKQDFSLLVEDISSILSDSEFRNEYQDHSFFLDYLDLRFGNKAYFKFIER